MCINYKAQTFEIMTESFTAPVFDAPLWPDLIWQVYIAPINAGDGYYRKASLCSYGTWPQKGIPEGVKKFSMTNARVEMLGSRKRFKEPWLDGQLCLVPLTKFYQPD